jgi:hypothetical protein
LTQRHFSFGVAATLSFQRYPFVKLRPRTTTGTGGIKRFTQFMVNNLLTASGTARDCGDRILRPARYREFSGGVALPLDRCKWQMPP